MNSAKILSAAKLLAALVAIGVISQTVNMAWPDAPPLVQTGIYLAFYGAVAAAVALTLWAVVSFFRGTIEELFGDTENAQDDAEVLFRTNALTTGEIKTTRNTAKDSRDEAAAQIKELAGLVDAFFVEAQQLSAKVSSLRKTRESVYKGTLPDEAMGAISAQDPSLAALLDHPEAWTVEIKNALASAIDREIGFLVQTVDQYRNRGQVLLRQWQTLRTTIISIDYHLLDTESARLSQAISEHLDESFAALDKIKLAKRVHDETLAERLISAVFRWQLPGQAKAPKKDPKRLSYTPDFVINLGAGETGQKDKEPVPAVNPRREWIEGAK